MEAIESGLNKIGLCCACHSSLLLEEKFESRKGLVTNISFSCSNPACKKSVLVSDPYFPEATALNNASIAGAKLAGSGLHAMEVVMACIGMVPPTRAVKTKHKFTAHAQAFFKHQDQLRLYKSQNRASEGQKKRRKYKAREKVAAEETAIAEEGPTYGPGEF